MIEKLSKQRNLSDDELLLILNTNKYDKELFCRADEIRRKIYGDSLNLQITVKTIAIIAE